MANRKLSEKQWAAIALLSLPKKGGLTFEQIAEKADVSLSTLHRWRRDETFTKALKDEIVRNTLDDLPEIMQSLSGHITESGNAAMLRTLLQAHGMLSEKVEVSNVGAHASIEELQAKVAKLRGDKSGE